MRYSGPNNFGDHFQQKCGIINLFIQDLGMMWDTDLDVLYNYSFFSANVDCSMSPNIIPAKWQQLAFVKDYLRTMNTRSILLTKADLFMSGFQLEMLAKLDLESLREAPLVHHWYQGLNFGC